MNDHLFIYLHFPVEQTSEQVSFLLILVDKSHKAFKTLRCE